MKSLEDLFQHTLKDVYYAENAIAKALPKVSKAAKSAELIQAVDAHLAETKDQIKQLEKVFK
jgi:ferritin-like metal-binding protein YciE